VAGACSNHTMKNVQLNSIQVFARGCTIAIRLMIITRLLSVLSIGIGVVPGREIVTEMARHGMYHATPILWTNALRRNSAPCCLQGTWTSPSVHGSTEQRLSSGRGRLIWPGCVVGVLLCAGHSACYGRLS
jgi:hypothetical protein